MDTSRSAVAAHCDSSFSREICLRKVWSSPLGRIATPWSFFAVRGKVGPLKSGWDVVFFGRSPVFGLQPFRTVGQQSVPYPIPLASDLPPDPRDTANLLTRSIWPNFFKPNWAPWFHSDTADHSNNSIVRLRWLRTVIKLLKENPELKTQRGVPCANACRRRDCPHFPFRRLNAQKVLGHGGQPTPGSVTAS